MLKKLMLVLSMFSLAGYGAVEISNVKAKQRYPWNEYIDLKFDLDCGSRPSATVTVAAKDKSTGKYLPVNTLWEVGNGPTNNYLVISSGEKHLIWNAGADLPSGYSSQNVNNTIFLVPYHANRGNDIITMFDARYVKAYEVLPTMYSYRGYDAVAIFCRRMFEGFEGINEVAAPLATPYTFTFEDGLYVNTYWVMERYKSNYTIDVE